MPVRLEDFEFVIGRETVSGVIEIENACSTEGELGEMYENWLLKSGFDSGFKPYQKRGDQSYAKLMGLAFEVEKRVRKKMAGDQKEAELESRVM